MVYSYYLPNLYCYLTMTHACFRGFISGYSFFPTCSLIHLSHVSVHLCTHMPKGTWT